MQGLKETLDKLQEDLEKAIAEKTRCQRLHEATQNKIQMANRLVGGLASENIRWAERVAQ